MVLRCDRSRVCVLPLLLLASSAAAPPRSASCRPREGPLRLRNARSASAPHSARRRGRRDRGRHRRSSSRRHRHRATHARGASIRPMAALLFRTPPPPGWHSGLRVSTMGRGVGTPELRVRARSVVRALHAPRTFFFSVMMAALPWGGMNAGMRKCGSRERSSCRGSKTDRPAEASPSSKRASGRLLSLPRSPALVFSAPAPRWSHLRQTNGWKGPREREARPPRRARWRSRDLAAIWRYTLDGSLVLSVLLRAHRWFMHHSLLGARLMLTATFASCAIKSVRAI